MLETAATPMRWMVARPAGRHAPPLRTGHCALPTSPSTTPTAAAALGCGFSVIGGLEPSTGAVLSCEEVFTLDVLGLGATAAGPLTTSGGAGAGDPARAQ